MRNTAVLLIDCPDRKGLVAGVSGLLYRYGANIAHADQHQDDEAGLFFMRVEWWLDGFDLHAFRAEFEQVAADLQMQWQLKVMSDVPRVALFVSQHLHCLVDILHRQQAGELHCEIPLVIGNHPDAEPLAKFYGVEFRHIPVKPETKKEAEQEQIGLLKANGIDLIVLARYMQVLSPALVGRWERRVINIHHGFLPAFQGAKPYHQAWAKGVKMIGATAHFVSDVLDQGPIIAQDVLRVADTRSVSEFIRMGKDVERKVLYEALRLYLDNSVFVREGRTFIIQ